MNKIPTSFEGWTPEQLKWLQTMVDETPEYYTQCEDCGANPVEGGLLAFAQREVG